MNSLTSKTFNEDTYSEKKRLTLYYVNNIYRKYSHKETIIPRAL